MKDLEKIKYCVSLKTEHKPKDILVYQSTCIENLLKRLDADSFLPLSTPGVVRSLDPKKNPIQPKEDDENIFAQEVPYQNAIGVLLFLVQCTRLDIYFDMNLLGSPIFEPTQR